VNTGMPYHKLLQKQLKKLLPGHENMPEEWQHFLETVSRSYATFEKDKNLSEHAFAISEKEYQEINNHLQFHNEITTESIHKLKAAIKSLDKQAPVSDADMDDDLINVINYLEKQILKTKDLEQLLIGAKESAELAAKAKSEFLSVMSHEIRTPLNAIIGNIHLLQQEEPLPHQKEFLKALQISANNLLSLINDVLDFNKIEEGKILFSAKDVDLRALLNNVSMAHRIRAADRGNKIELLVDEAVPAVVKADDVRLNQILNNLVSNAIKFTKDGNIALQMQVAQQNETGVAIVFSVSDTGIGIPKEKQALIFERFTQANSEITREYGGSGLGLTIIKRLLQLQQSDIHLESNAGKGSVFSFTLHFEKSDAVIKEEDTIDTQQYDLLGARVLLVEDVHFNVMVAEKMLTNWNAVVEVADNGKIAVDKLSASTYDIVLMDLQMPVMDGYTAARTIRELQISTPIVALSASSSGDVIQKVLNCGMNGFVSKPFVPEELFKVIYKHTVVLHKVA
jgi:signal transduction histidine kinase/ActR/RegA family two-component response regulator